MYLKSLEIQGFKSFPSHTRLTFDKPVSAIVGPNGSGKSNIADAILWVMGEQSSKSLRGGKMEDVIFGGTKLRAQVGYAEVSLVLDNSNGRFNIDTTEVMLTRRYFRSGESEYYINQSLVKLREMAELLMDTGLGRDGYSIIGQGKIAEIISSKSKERREIFEEAAGISKYRHRKEESERKLQQTDANLDRIADRILILEEQLEPLAKEAEVAEKCQILEDELRGIEVSLWVRKLNSFKDILTKTEADLAVARNAAQAAKDEIEEYTETVESLEEIQRETDREIESVRESISKLETTRSDITSNIRDLKTRHQSHLDQIDNLTSELKNQDDTHDNIGVQISSKEDRLREIDLEKSQVEEELVSVQDKLSDIITTTDKSDEKHNILIAKEQEIKTELSNLKSEFSALATLSQELLDMESSVQKELAIAKEELALRQADVKKCSDTLEKAKEEASSLTNIIQGLNIKVQGREKKVADSQDKINHINNELSSLQSRQTLLSEMKDSFEEYSEPVRSVMKEHKKGTLKNIFGTVGNLLSTEDTHTLAIETALGSAMQYIIVDKESDAKAAINHLKRTNSGRSTFFPLSTIKGDKLGSSSFEKNSGFLGIAVDLVRFDSKYEGVFNRLLGRVIIADNLDNAADIAKSQGHKYKVVTLDGQVINAGGSMTGGSSGRGKNVGTLSRANELKTLSKHIDNLASNLGDLSKAHKELIREFTAAQYEQSTAADELRVCEESVLKSEMELSHCTDNLRTCEKTIGAFEDELKSIKDRSDQNIISTEKIKSQLTTMENKELEVRSSIEKMIDGNKQLSADRELINDKLSSLRTKIASLDAQTEPINKSLSELVNIRDEMLSGRERQNETISELLGKNEQIEAEISMCEKSLIKTEKNLEEQGQRVAKLGERKLEFEAKTTDYRKTYNQKHEKIILLERECSKLESKIDNTALEEQSIVDRLIEKYQLGPVAAQNEVVQIDNITAAKNRVAAINDEISALGDVNKGAIKQFQRINEQYTHYTTQRDDVEKAKSDLLDIIDEITAKMREIFINEFNIINESFQKTFKDLFGGGSAELKLEDPDDVLGCGIEIEVHPPGKSLKTITLLSGGEKALVAIAIYFSILSVRPPPFVVLDEIDAALDDANVIKFAEHMRKMSDNSQMIVITHKRGTMEEADVLFGVTMQELGVSNLLCVDMAEAEKHLVVQKVSA